MRTIGQGHYRMAETAHVCPKCSGLMEQGFIVDMSYGGISGRARNISKWARGTPLKSVLYEISAPREAVPIGAFRCASCGYIESYANPEFAATGQPKFSLRSLMVFVTVVAIVLGIIVWAVRS